MASSSSDDDALPLSQHLEVLYPLACLLTGPDEAPALLRRVFERVATELDANDADDLDARLVKLLAEVHAADATTEESESEPATPEDPFHREAARDIVERALPLALSACTPRERFVLALDVLGEDADASERLLVSVLGPPASSAHAQRDEARASLRQALSDTLTSQERSVVDASLTEDTLREVLHELLLDRFHPVPPVVRARTRTLLRNTGSAAGSSPRPAESSSREETSQGAFARLVARLSSATQARRFLTGLVFILVLVAGALLFLNGPQPGSDAPPNLVAFSVEHAGTIQPDLETSSASEAESFVLDTWDRRISPPTIEGATLQGVGRLAVAEGADVPVFLYTDTSESTPLTVFAFNYAFLDRLQSQAVLDKAVLNELGENERLVSQEDAGHEVVLWRQRDDILIAVGGSAETGALQPRIQP